MLQQLLFHCGYNNDNKQQQRVKQDRGSQSESTLGLDIYGSLDMGSEGCLFEFLQAMSGWLPPHCALQSAPPI